MQPETEEHLATAERNRRFAEGALADPDSLPALREWGAVAAFYGAVHYVNALLFERFAYEPRNQAERTAAINRVSELRALRRHYQRLNDAGYRARYVPMYAVSDERLRQLVEVHLRRIGDDVTDLLASAE
jgi:hypothetical protein